MILGHERARAYLVVTFGALRGQGYGASTRSTIEQLRSLGDVTVVAFDPSAGGDARHYLLRAFSGEVHVVHVPCPPFRSIQHLRLRPRVLTLACRALSDEARSALSATYDLVVFEGDALLGLLPSRSAARRLIIFHDDDAVRYLRAARAAFPSLRAWARFSDAVKAYAWQRLFVRRDVDVMLGAVALADAHRLTARLRRSVSYVPPRVGANLHVIAPSTSSGTLLFVGPSSYESNRHALRWLVSGASNWLLENLVIVGEGWSEPEWRPLTRLGFVEDLPAVYADASIVIAPMQDGGGTKIKVLEAMHAGRVVVGTRYAFDGLPPSAGLVEVQSVAELEAAIRGFLADDITRSALEAENRSVAMGLADAQSARQVTDFVLRGEP